MLRLPVLVQSKAKALLSIQVQPPEQILTWEKRQAVSKKWVYKQNMHEVLMFHSKSSTYFQVAVTFQNREISQLSGMSQKMQNIAPMVPQSRRSG